MLPSALTGDNPALLSGGDSDKLGLISLNAEEVFAFDRTSIRVPTDGAETHKDMNHKTYLCNHVEELHASTTTAGANHCKTPPTPSKVPVRIPLHRRLLPAGMLQKEDVLQQYDDSLKGRVAVLGLQCISK